MNLRIGHGVDAHRLVAGRTLYVGGVEIPHDHGLLGHSDGDVACHALGDAVLNGAGLGTLGDHFPSLDPVWAEKRSTVILNRIADLIAAREMEVRSASVVVLAQEPQLASFLGSMAEVLGQALGVGGGVIHVSATSTDGLGFTGRGEGMAATAVALLEAK